MNFYHDGIGLLIYAKTEERLCLGEKGVIKGPADPLGI
jgi:hypothetical protein